MRYSRGDGLVVGLIVCLVVAIAATPLGRWLEQTMFTHVLIELPLLVILGILLGLQFNVASLPWINAINLGGFWGLIAATFLLAFWMIPRWLDFSLTSPAVAYAKYGSMLIIGLLLVASWSKAHVITRAVVKIEFLTMLYRLGWIYLISPDRLCNNYLLSDQIWLGRGLLITGFALAIAWMLPLFISGQSMAMLVDKSVTKGC